MGYSYGQNDRGNWVLACDKCGSVGATRKRACRFKVTDDQGRNPLPWCPAPALCGSCFKEKGGSAGIHGDRCREGAAHAQAQADATRARMEAGDKKVFVAYGDWHAQVAAGMVVAGFRGADGVEEYRTMPKDDYKTGGFLSDYSDSTPVAFTG